MKTQQAIIDADVISSSTPLEMELAGVHPRLHVTQERLTGIRSRLDERPYRYMVAAMERGFSALQAEAVLPEDDPGQPVKVKNFQSAGADKRNYGDRISHCAGLWLLTGNRGARDKAIETMHALAAYESWTHSLTFGHWAEGMACGIDWLWDELSAEDRDYFLDVLEARARVVFDVWSSYRSGEPFGYTWNIMAVVMGGLGAAASVLYGERPNISPMLNLVLEKVRLIAFALGRDGVSPEGMMYGSYYVLYMTGTFVLMRDLLGVNLFHVCDWYRNFPHAIYTHSLPRESWTEKVRYFQFGDAHGDSAAYGLSRTLWAVGDEYKDGNAQWIANALSTVAPGQEEGGIFSALWYNPEVAMEKPCGLSTLSRFADLDIVIGRSNWSGTESVYGVKCGPPAGHLGSALYPNPLAGGHMHPNSGGVQIFSHGDWILPHPGYTWKRTGFHNCLLVNGQGQIGEESEWFEDLPYRQGAPKPSILVAAETPWGSRVVANVGPAYPEALGVTLYLRHVFHLKPDCWIVIDAITFRTPATPEVLWHTQHPWVEGHGVYRTEGERATGTVTPLLGEGLVLSTEEQTILHSSKYEIEPLQLLRMRTAEPVKKALFVTAIATAEKGNEPAANVSAVFADGTLSIAISGDGSPPLCFDPWQALQEMIGS